MPTAYPLINGVRHSYSSIELRINGSVILGCTEINYTTKLEPSVVRAAGALPIGLTLGNADFDGDFSLLLQEFNDMIIALGPGAMTIPFDIVVAYDASLGNVLSGGLDVIVDTLQGCRITNIEASNSGGSTDATVRKCTIKPTMILLNGIALTPEQPTAAA